MAVVLKRDLFTPRPSIVRYSDFTSNFSAHAGDLYRVTNDDSVIQSLKNLLLTNPGERVFNPSYGCNIRGLLFENFSPAVESTLRNIIEESIKAFEPRVEIIDVKVGALPDNQALIVTLVFRTINNQSPQSLDLILNRVR
jgi:uncharacterized protein